MQLDGGYSAPGIVNARSRHVAESVRSLVERQAGRRFTKYEPHSAKRQIVAGENFAIKIYVGDMYIHIAVHCPLAHTGRANELMSYQGNKSLQDPL